MSDLLTTKLFSPRRRPNSIERPRLIRLLKSGLGRKLTLVIAPAGFGKTTLLGEWIPQSERCVAWVTLEEGDNDPARFWSYFIAALQMLDAEIGKNTLGLLQSPQPPPTEAILNSLLNDIAGFPDNFAHVLDDYQVIQNPSIHAAIQYFLEHIPAHMHLVVASRTDPPLPLGRLRAHDQLNEIRSADLRFTPDETAAFLNQTMGLKLSTENVNSLEAHTEGWIAGLQLAGLALQGHGPQPDARIVSEFIAGFTGSHRYIISYLVEEVLSQQPAGTMDFLLQTSILDRLCESLCDAVTGDSGGQAVLENLEQANLFITPLDHEGKWYRYHYLFAEVLQARLRQSRPELLGEIHGRASAWYEAHDFLAEAVKHALAAGNAPRVVGLIERERWTFLERGEAATLQGWLNQLPVEMVKRSPGLSLAYAWIFTLLRQAETIEPHIQAAENALDANSTSGADLDAVAEHGIRGEIATLRAAIALSQSNIPRALELCRYALEQLPEDNLRMRGYAIYFLGHSERRGGHITAAGRFFAQSSTLSLQADNLLIALHALANLTNIQITMGRLKEAAETSQRVLQITADRRRQAWPVAGLAYYGLGKLHYEWDDLDAALRFSRLGVESGQRGGMTGLEFTCRFVLALTLQAQDEGNGADRVLREIAALTEQHPNPVNAALAAVWEARLRLRQGRLEQAVRWAERCLPFDEQVVLPYSREVEYLTYARVRIAQGRTGMVLPLLTRLEKAAKSDGRTGSLIEIWMLQALAHQVRGDSPSALDLLERALILAEPEGYVRIFVDEGYPMLTLLIDLQSRTSDKLGAAVDDRSTRLLAYIKKLRSAFSQPVPTASEPSGIVVEPLSARELEVLHWMAEGASNQEISIQLFIAHPTVKRHVSNIFNKLGVGSRTKAVAAGRKLGLL
jgi:LuxR family maltose regulon positive regulatory protein